MNGETRMESWTRRHRGWLWGSVGALVVLVAVGASVRAPVKDWWLAREACGGELSGDDLKTVRTGVRLGSETESFDEERGAYHCVLKSDRDKVVVAVDTYPAGADRNEELSFVARSYAPHAVLPGGLPGFEDEYSRVLLMPECPRGKGSSGKPRRLLVGTWAYFAESREEKAAMLRLAVRMTNVVTGKLGCGGAPLPAPKDGAVPDTGASVPRAEAKGTACAALATTRVPAEGRDGTVRIAVADGGVLGRCTLRAPGTDGDGAKPGRPLVELTGWRGDWGTVPREADADDDSSPSGGDAARRPVLTDSLAWATATCGGEDVGFTARWGEDYFHRKSGEPSGPPTDAERKERRALLGEYVTAFAKDQVRRDGCTALRLPAHP
ncbi:hypothetical protein ACFVFH_12045 [Streptomyces sp. NPDC057697]|uniref:hypothetical protein n=1 Tax=Streptomyces sp. NPDC057697 TaxID=3346219 RepID=UPI00368D0F55